ncbi:PEP-CTERM sorting domain-containing protein [Planktothrix mougeotii]|uniref:PEP-CTERM sorting domain-containing protein n=1 Tax=Planktothrix mougeotii LEGE 06226 TaxID=1828728 RepID=A0ABR9UG06_9CYAN|nr:PEP-CTERM sorting domain-containing protein [Planktothrix mougeotii]MBE9145024.1 PEP-CTERM sorting domain-containing protein [Planktothrix mougeotii LEGE 06226]
MTTNLKQVSSLKLGGTDDFFNLLSSSVWASNGWAFQRSTTNLAGSFNIGVYAPLASMASTSPGVSGEIQLFYNPVIGQDPIGNQVHFIQRVFNNHAVIATRQGNIELPYGTLENKIDTVIEQTNPIYVDLQNPQKQTFNPFYDTYGQVWSYSNSSILVRDVSGRNDFFNNNDWSAELYLVQETAPKTVTIYNGISWGWNNTFTPSPPPISQPPLPCDGSSGGGGCVTTASDIAIRELPVSDFDSGDPNQLPEKVPEPTTLLGLLALGVAGTIEILKNKFNKQ